MVNKGQNLVNVIKERTAREELRAECLLTLKWLDCLFAPCYFAQFNTCHTVLIWCLGGNFFLLFLNIRNQSKLWFYARTYLFGKKLKACLSEIVRKCPFLKTISSNVSNVFKYIGIVRSLKYISKNIPNFDHKWISLDV